MSTDEYKFDIISALPLEISTTIFRMLDPSAMKAALTVRRNWYHIYQSDSALRRIFRRRVRQRIRERQRLAKYLTNHRRVNTPRRPPKQNGEKKRKSRNGDARQMGKKPRYDFEDTYSSATKRPMRM
ncbi:hypothetical protein U1Q18_043497 [Sarracenia purpurea var. burkii]